jgi:hypothetical protein
MKRWHAALKTESKRRALAATGNWPAAAAFLVTKKIHGTTLICGQE